MPLSSIRQQLLLVDDEEDALLELAELLVGLYPARRLTVDRRHAPDSPGYIPSAYSRLVPDVARLRALGWTAQIDPAAGFRRSRARPPTPRCRADRAVWATV